ncbi:MAG: CARDB domain-containing protein, partial [Dehalococcoidia bacterium]|nr:CARDB domain-containing protein [Dehalococcoidia bacterium]
GSHASPESAPVITVTKTASPTDVAPGDQVTYTIQLNNTGDQTATTREIVDTLPASSGFSYILGSTTGGITANPQVTAGGRVLTWGTVPGIAAGGTLTFSFRVLTGSATGQFYNQVVADGQNYTDVSTGNTAPVFVGPRIRITKTSSPSVAPAGTNVTYTVVINNDTAGTNATLTTIQDTLASGFSYVSGSTTGVITANPQVTGQVNLTWTGTWTVVGGGSFTFSFQAAATLNWGTFYNTVTVQGTNFPTVTTGPTAAVTTVGWILITKTVDNPSPGGGEAVTYTITVSNVGPSTVSISKITDTIPTTFTYVTGSTSGAVSGNPSITGNTLTWQGAQIPSSIAAGAQFSFSFGTTVPNNSDDYTNEASIFVTWLADNYTISTGPTATVSVTTQARIVISEASGDTSGPPGWGNVNVKGYSFAPNKTLVLYWVDMNNPLDPRTATPTGTSLLPGQVIITLSSSYAPVSFNPISITIPSNANWGEGYVVALMEKSSSVWEEQDRKPFNVRAKYEIVSQTADAVTLTARVAFTGNRSPDGTYSTPTNTPLITIYMWKE